ncbi:LysE family translocator [Rhizobium bangladeshense]|nr:LysE family translocator [Rhizobium bangladeshense]
MQYALIVPKRKVVAMSIPLHQYFIFISIVTMIVVTPGPNLALLLANSPSNTKLTGFGMVFGFAAAIVSHATLALVGVGAVIAASAILFTVMKLLGAAYLIWLGIKSLLSLRRLNAPVINPSRVSVNLTAREPSFADISATSSIPNRRSFTLQSSPNSWRATNRMCLQMAPRLHSHML